MNFSEIRLNAADWSSILLVGFLVKFLSPVLIIFVLFYAVSEGLKTNPPKEEIPVEQEVPPVEEVVDV